MKIKVGTMCSLVSMNNNALFHRQNNIQMPSKRAKFRKKSRYVATTTQNSAEIFGPLEVV